MIRRDAWLAGLLFAALTIAFAYPLSFHPTSLRFPTGPDGDLGWYLLGWDTHAFFHRPWAIFDANIYYPQRLTLAYGENVIGIAFFAAPVIWLTGNLLLAANFVCILSSILCGVAAYVLGRRIGLSVAAGVICGIIFECAPPRFLRIGQMNLSSVQWIPFGLAAMHGYLQTGRRRDLRLAALCVTLQALTSGHGAVFMAVALVVFLAYRIALGEPLRFADRVRDLGVIGVLALVPTVLVFLPYLAVQKEVGLKRGLGTWESNYNSFLASPSHVHRYVLSAIGLSDMNAKASAFLFPGYLALLLGVMAIPWRRPRMALNRETASRLWSHCVLVLEAAVIPSAAIAGLLTVATEIPMNAGTSRLVDPPTAIAAWKLVALFAVVGLLVVRWIPGAIVSRHARPLVALLICAVCWAAFTVMRPKIPAGDGLKADYFPNTTWTGVPTPSVVDPEPSVGIMRERWNRAPPAEFSVAWNGFITIGSGGMYTFTLASDDGSVLEIDNHLVVDNGGRHALNSASGNIQLRRGSHAVVLRYVQFGGDSVLRWSWSADGGRSNAVPGWVLSTTRTDYATAIAARLVDWALLVLAVATGAVAVQYMRAALEGRAEPLGRWAEGPRRNATTFYVVLTLVALGLALGPPYGLWRFVYRLPGFTFIRANSRFTILALLGLAVLAGIGFDRMTRQLPDKRRRTLAAVIGVILMLEYAAMPIAVQRARFEIPAIDRWLDSQPKPFVVAEVPIQDVENVGAFERQEVSYMLHSTAHWQKTVHGYSGWRTDFHRELYKAMQGFPDDASLASLCDVGVTFVVVHRDYYPPGEWTAVDARLRQFSSELRLEHVEGTARVYSLVKPQG